MLGTASVLYPADPRLADVDRAVSLIAEAADEAGVNVFRVSTGYDATDRRQCIIYAHLTVEDSPLLSRLPLVSGRMLTRQESAASASFLASSNPSTLAQVGRITNFGFGDSGSLMVRGFPALVEDLPAHGEYRIESTDERSRNSFVDSLNQRLSEWAGIPTEVELSDAPTTRFWAPDPGLSGLLTLLIAAVLLVYTFLSIYLISTRAKAITVLRLNGLSSSRVWVDEFGSVACSVTLVASAVCVALAATTPGAGAAYVGRQATSTVVAGLVGLVVSYIAYQVACRLSMTRSLKGGIDRRPSYVLNAVAQVLIIAYVALLGANLLSQVGQLSSERARVEGWQPVRNYALFYPTKNGYDQAELVNGRAGPLAAQTLSLYETLNSAGALYVDASSYVDAANSPYPPTVTVNPNYLRQYPLIDAAGQQIIVEEGEEAWVVLVPEKYRGQEVAITKYFQAQRTGAGGFEAVSISEQRFFGYEPPSRFSSQPIELRWIANGQDLFSFDWDVNPTEGNVIADPIVQVLTVHNSLGVDRLNMITGTGADALKVVVDDMDPETTMAALRPTLSALQLDDNLTSLRSVPDVIDVRVRALGEEIRTQMTALLVSLMLAAGIGIQNAVIAFDFFGRTVANRRVFGYGFWAAHSEIFLLTGGIVGAQCVLALVLLLSPIGRALPLTAGSGLVSQTELSVGCIAVATTVLIATAAAAKLHERGAISSILNGK